MSVEKLHYRCPKGCIAKVMVYPTDDYEACPRLPEHSLCDVCGAVLLELDPETEKPRKVQPPRPHERVRVKVLGLPDVV